MAGNSSDGRTWILFMGHQNVPIIGERLDKRRLSRSGWADEQDDGYFREHLLEYVPVKEVPNRGLEPQKLPQDLNPLV